MPTTKTVHRQLFASTDEGSSSLSWHRQVVWPCKACYAHCKGLAGPSPNVRNADSALRAQRSAMVQPTPLGLP
eukprot:973853-Alexandrium_andersonii.AAC.1